MKRVIVSVSNDLVTDQRVFKTCLTLQEQGYEILLVGRNKRSREKITRDYKTKRMNFLFHKGFLFYVEFNFRLFFLLLFSKKDILFSNDLDTLIPNYLVSKLTRTKLIFDSHELFSEVPEIQNKTFVKSVWLRIEKWIIPKLKNVITVSNSIQKHYKRLYNVEATVIRNVPISKKVEPKKLPFSTKEKKIILYQGSVNLGRGLELMINTMKLLDNYILVIIGDGDIMDRLEQEVLLTNMEKRVKFTGKVHPKELKSLTLNADIGFSLEEDLGLNYRYALPNKLFDYIQAEVPVIVSDLPDMKDLVKHYEIGEVLENRTPEDLANLVDFVIHKDFSKQLSKAKEELNWQKEKEKLIAILKS